MKLIKKRSEATSSFLDVITPLGIDFMPRTIAFGDHYRRVLIIYDYPFNVTKPGWLGKIARIPGVTTTFHALPIDSYNLISDLKASLGELAAQKVSHNPYTAERAISKYNGAINLLNGIEDEGQQVFDIHTLITIFADSLEELETKSRIVESKVRSLGMRARAPLFEQEEALLSVYPQGYIDPEIKRMSKRNMPSQSFASGFPFVYSGLNDGRGAFLGKDAGGGICLVDFTKRDGSRVNSNIVISGKPGSGKSTLAKKVIRKLISMGAKIIIIDPEREYKDLCEKAQGDWIDCGGGKGKINPLQMREVPEDDDEEDGERLVPNDVKSKGPLASHIHILRTFFKMYMPEMTKTHMALLEKALIHLYTDENYCGFSWDTKPQDIPNDKFPIMEDLYELVGKIVSEVKQTQDRDHLTAWTELHLWLESIAVGADSYLWNGHTTIDPKSNLIVLDINSLMNADQGVLQTQYFNLLSFTWNEASKDRSEFVAIVGDELYLIIDPENPMPMKFWRNIDKRIRKYEGGLISITQNTADFLDPAVKRFGEPILSNPTYKFLFIQGEKDAETLDRLMTFSEKEKDLLLNGNRGEALFSAGKRRLQLNVIASNEELDMFGSAGGR